MIIHNFNNKQIGDTRHYFGRNQRLLTKIISMVVIVTLIISFYYDTVNAENEPFTTEIIVRTVENFKNHKEVVNFISLASKNHVSIINLNVKEDEDDAVPSGYVFYNSKIAPKASGYENYDVLKDVITEAHKKGIQVRAWIPQFHDKAAMEKNSDWQMQYIKNNKVIPFTGSNGAEYFVNPINADVQQYEKSIIMEIVSNYDIDGVVLDWLRFDDFNMDMSGYTREKYNSSFGYDPITIDFSTDNAKRRQWNDWRTTQIGNYVKSIRSEINVITPDLFLGVYILPPEFDECGQDVAKFQEYVDFISPMAYFKDWGYQTSWVYDKSSGILADIRKKTLNKEIIPALDITWTDAEYKEIYSGFRKNYPDVHNISYFIYGKWTKNMLNNIDKRRSWN